MIRPGRRQHTTPIVVDRLDEAGSARALAPVPMGGSTHEAKHDEKWLQKLLHEFPQTLPVRDIDPGFGGLVPVGLEIPTSAGSIDNFFVTNDGDLAIVECKLWRNPEARREVVAQIIDYAHALARCSYEDLDRAIQRGELPDGRKVDRSLFAHVSEQTDLGEDEFVDAVSRNLRSGRMLLLIVGDGVRQGAETLSEYLQLHAGFHFTLVLIEMPVFHLPESGFLIQPRIVARTVNIERGIVRVVDGQPRIEPPAHAAGGTPTARVTTPTLERLFEGLERSNPGLAQALRRFEDLASDRGIFLEPSSKSIMIKWLGPDERSYTLGGVDERGLFNTYFVNWVPNEIGRMDLSHAYLDAIAALVGGELRKTPKPIGWYVAQCGTTLPAAADLLQRSEAWLAAIDRYTEALAAAQQPDS